MILLTLYKTIRLALMKHHKRKVGLAMDVVMSLQLYAMMLVVSQLRKMTLPALKAIDCTANVNAFRLLQGLNFIYTRSVYHFVALFCKSGCDTKQ